MATEADEQQLQAQSSGSSQYMTLAANSAGGSLAARSIRGTKAAAASGAQQPRSAVSCADEYASGAMDIESAQGPAILDAAAPALPVANEQIEDGQAFLDQLSNFFQAWGEQPPHLLRWMAFQALLVLSCVLPAPRLAALMQCHARQRACRFCRHAAMSSGVNSGCYVLTVLDMPTRQQHLEICT